MDAPREWAGGEIELCGDNLTGTALADTLAAVRKVCVDGGGEGEVGKGGQ